jgi:hypothetical protein
MKTTPEIMAKCVELENGLYKYLGLHGTGTALYRYFSACEGCGHPYLGRIRYVKGEEVTPKFCDRLCRNTNRKMTDEERARLSVWAKQQPRRKHTEEAKSRMSVALRGLKRTRQQVIAQAKRISLPDGEAAFGNVYNSYRQSARKRGLDFALSKEQFKTLTQRPCSYCGSQPHAIKASHGTIVSSSYTYTGVDRLTSSLGYTVNNVLPCCHACNIAKLARTATEFLTWAQQVFEFSVMRNYTLRCIDAIPEEQVHIARQVYMQYRRGARNRALPFNLDFALFSRLLRTQCYYCGAMPSTIAKTRRNETTTMLRGGVDRVDSSLGYVQDNVVPCCTACNWAKSALPQAVFLSNTTSIMYHLSQHPSILAWVQHYAGLQEIHAGFSLL